jgi:hypothetical protein
VDTLRVANVGDGTYYVVEADSTGWIHLGYVLNGTKVAGTANNVAVSVASGQSVTVIFVNASPSYSVYYRTVNPNLLAQDLDNKGKPGKIVKEKADKYFWTVTFANTYSPVNDLHIEFGSAVDTTYPLTITGMPGRVTSTAWDSKMKKLDITFSDTLLNPDTLVVTGFSKGKQKVSKYYWTYNGTSTSPKPLKGFVAVNEPKNPMPNRINILASSFPTSTGLIVGIPGDVKQFGWIAAKKYTDVVASLFDKKTSYHSGNPRGFDHYDGGVKPILKGLKSLPPTKQNNLMIADMLALRVNILASALKITPDGFYNLIYHDTSSRNPFNGLTVSQIADTGDAIMMGTYTAGVHTFADTSVFNALHATISAINNSFEGPIDTESFAGTLKVKGTKKLADVPFLHANPSAAPMKIVAANYGHELVTPQEYKLYQNYPNPFNPTTNIDFDLPQMSIVSLKVYNILGQEVATLLDNAQFEEGTQTVEFNASNFASGVYFYRLITSSTTNADGEVVGSQFVKVGKMLLIK